MKKFLLVCAALACCSALAQASIVKDYFSEMCARTEIVPIEMPVSQMPGEAKEQGVDIVKVARMTDETSATALALAESWDKSKLAVDISQNNASVKVFAEEVEDGNKAECLIMVKEENSPFVFIYMEGDAKILKTLNESL